MSYYFDDEDDFEPIKYKIGDKNINSPSIGQYTLFFAFDYVSLNGTKYCFNNPQIKHEHFVEIYHFKRDISSIIINDFTDNSRLKQKYHFHSIDIFQKRYLVPLFCKLLGMKQDVDPSKLPTLYQFAIFTNNETSEAPRIVGFFGKMGIFYVLWLDYEHDIYKKQR